MPDINFLRQRSHELARLEQSDRQWFRYATWVISAVVILALITVGIRFFLVQSFSKIQAEQAKTKSSILSQESTEKTYLLFVHKLKALSSLLSLHRDKQEAITFFTDVFPKDILVEQISYEAKGGVLAFVILAPDVFVMDQAYGTLSKTEIRQKYPNMTTSRLQRGDDGAYRMQVTVTMGGE